MRQATLLIVGLFIAFALCYDCGTLSTLAAKSKYEKFVDKQLLYIVVEDENNDEIYRSVYCPSVDYYSVLKFNGFWTITNVNSLKINYHVELWSQGKMLFKTSSKVLKDTQYFVPFRVVEVTVEDGVVKDLQWDEQLLCSLCSTKCVDGACGVTFSGKSVTTDGSFQPKIYVAWVGTDINGYYMTSSSDNVSQFNFLDATSMAESMSSLI